MKTATNVDQVDTPELSPEVDGAYKELAELLKSSDTADTVDLEQLRGLTNKTAEHSKVIGKWPAWKNVNDTIGYRIPKSGQKDAPGMDAGLAYCLGMVPHGPAGEMVARLHQNHFIEDHDELIAEMSKDQPDPNSPSVWYLAMCTLCEEEGKNDEEIFRKYLKRTFELRNNPEERLKEAKKQFDAFQHAKPAAQIEVQDKDGKLAEVPFSIGWDGFLGAYNKGYRLTTMYDPNSKIYFVGTAASMSKPGATSMKSALASFSWKNPDKKDAEGKTTERGTSGILSENLLKCADKEEMIAVLEAVAKSENADEIFRNCPRKEGSGGADAVLASNRKRLEEVLPTEIHE